MQQPLAQTLALLEPTISNPSTETFTEGLSEDRKRISRDDVLLRSLRLRSCGGSPGMRLIGFAIYIVTHNLLCQIHGSSKLFEYTIGGTAE